MENNFAIIGGDERIIHLAKMLTKDKHNVYLYGFEKIPDMENCSNLEQAIKNAKIIISSIPFSNDGINIYAPFSEKEIQLKELSKHIENKVLFAGSIQEKTLGQSNAKIIDLMEQEDLTILNTIATAEGAISEIITNTKTILQNSKVLIIGFGRVAKTLAKKLAGLDAKVTCSARKDKDFAWIETLGYNVENTNELLQNLKNYDIIINTVPQLILNEERIKYIKKDCLLLDLASKPGGIDQKSCEKQEIKFIWSLAIPGKVAPITSAKFIKNTIYNIIRKEKIISI